MTASDFTDEDVLRGVAALQESQYPYSLRPVRLTELPPVLWKGKPIEEATTARAPATHVTGHCHDCDTPVTGERWYCGPCAAQRDTRRVR
ncbi:MAG: hypothetical protein MUF33_02230 [Candidatus Nanopelagicales bacterium]|jgi:hypothetical protein|nr:hypothetical protein [Candidatus Nanopelagicales bacterium]